MRTIVLLPILWHLGGILALLLTWRYHRQRVDVGLTSAGDLFNPSGIKWYLYAVQDDPEVCASCRAAHGTAFHPSKVPEGKFTPSVIGCEKPEMCGGVLIPFAGRWFEADEITKELQSMKSGTRMLFPKKLKKLAATEWQGVVSKLDVPGVHLLSAFLVERSQPMRAMRSYGSVIKHAMLPRDQSLLMAAYLRLAGLLAQHGNPRQALEVIEHFEKRVARADAETFTPTGKQRRALITMKPYLYSIIDGDAPVPKPALVEAPAGNNDVLNMSDPHRALPCCLGGES